MKKYAAIFLFFIPLLTASSCVVVDDTESVSIADSLKIRTWVLDEELEGSGYWAFDWDDFADRGHWVSDDGTIIDDGDEVFFFEELEPNKPRITAPLSYSGHNLNIRLESEDVINVTATVRSNEEIILAYSPSSPDEVIFKDWSVSDNITVMGPFTLSVLPIGKTIPSSQRNLLSQSTTLTDREYYIDIKTYTLDGRPVISAQIKLTVLEDEHFPWQEFTKGNIHSGQNQSRFLSIELVKYGFDDTALHDEFEKYDALYN